MKDMPFKFIPKVTDRTRYRPSRSISKRAYRMTIDLLLNIPQQIYIAQRSLTIFNLMQYFLHPACSLSTRRTLSTAFVMVEPCEVQRIAHDTLVFIKGNEPTGSHSRTGHKTTISQGF